MTWLTTDTVLDVCIIALGLAVFALAVSLIRLSGRVGHIEATANPRSNARAPTTSVPSLPFVQPARHAPLPTVREGSPGVTTALRCARPSIALVERRGASIRFPSVGNPSAREPSMSVRAPTEGETAAGSVAQPASDGELGSRFRAPSLRGIFLNKISRLRNRKNLTCGT